MKIRDLNINGIGGISSISINFDQQMNIICGPNGIGKTTILECIAHLFAQSRTNVLKKNVNFQTGTINASLIESDQVLNKRLTIDHFIPTEGSFIDGLTRLSKKLITIKVNRNFSYQQIDAIARDTVYETHHLSEQVKFGADSQAVKNWFIHRHLYSGHENSLNLEQIYNYNLAKRSFSVLNDQFNFSRVKGDTNDIMLQTPNGEIYYEYLSSGFKSAISIIIGIIKEIEFRFKEPSINADSFNGVILIDELELHLHPEWQAKIVDALLNIFPHAQFIVSTHSPHILQNAQANQIIALDQNEELIVQRDLSEFIFGFQGWTVEEILTDVMGMSDTRTDLYKQTLIEFNNAIENENTALATQHFHKLDQLLHPTNHLRKLLKLELASIGGEI